MIFHTFTKLTIPTANGVSPCQSIEHKNNIKSFGKDNISAHTSVRHHDVTHNGQTPSSIDKSRVVERRGTVRQEVLTTRLDLTKR